MMYPMISGLDELVQAMNDLGWDVYSFDQEDAPGQFETDFDYADVLTISPLHLEKYDEAVEVLAGLMPTDSILTGN